ncbi:hypothetical protein VI06_16305 [Aquitalea magnusonii]|nr:hypothetical protein VI06_16305 [Aquitalea magnusonii]
MSRKVKLVDVLAKMTLLREKEALSWMATPLLYADLVSLISDRLTANEIEEFLHLGARIVRVCEVGYNLKNKDAFFSEVDLSAVIAEANDFLENMKKL